MDMHDSMYSHHHTQLVYLVVLSSIIILGRSGGYPYWVILGSLVLSVSFIGGMAVFEEETDGSKLWIPSGSDIIWQQEWVAKSFPSRISISDINKGV